MDFGDLIGVFVLGILGFVIINEISNQKWCGRNCRVILSDARGTLVQDIVTGLIGWI